MQLLPHTTRNIFANAQTTSISLALSEYINQNSLCTHLVITENAQLALQLYDELSFLLTTQDVVYFADLEILPFDHFSASEDVISSRLSTLNRIQNHDQLIIIANATTLLKYLPPQSFLNQQSFVMKKGDRLDITQKKRQLETVGYQNVSQVISRGEFSVRGSILDIFPMGSDEAYRIDLFDDEIDSIRTIDLETQRSNNLIDKIQILPTQEFVLDKKSLDQFAQNWFSFLPHAKSQNQIYQQIIKGQSISGIEFYLPLFYERLCTIFDYVPQKTIVHSIYNCQQALERYYQDIIIRHDQLAHDHQRPILRYDKVFLSVTDFNQKLQTFNHIKWLKNYKPKANNLITAPITDIHVHYHYKEPYQNLLDLLNGQTFKKVIFCAESSGRKALLYENLTKLHLKLHHHTNWSEAISTDEQYIIIVAPFTQGVILNQNYAIITEFDLFASHSAINLRSRKIKKDIENFPTVALKDLSELTIGSPVVHIEHGIARYDGLTKLDVGNQETEFLTLSFKNDEKLYVPIYALHLVSRYSGTDLEHAPISKLGSDQWEKEKEKAAKKINDVAADLLDIYAKRLLKKGYGNIFNENEYLAFCEGFPFEETPDQAIAINDVIKDMITEKPMDRLVCGDVGFGKTEVAMRAAFIAINNNKQVAILAPTTLLAQQHFENFSDRFSETGANVDVLSRFKTTREQGDAIEKINNGMIDIIIGTHKLLSDKIKFHNLGLLIIDEEHRFGVTHKEKMKALRTNIDILTMTATPIPRTLNMAFSNIRDLSVISTPPAKRLSVKTFIRQFNISIIREAIMRETLRGGQVYYLHNSVITIYDKSEQLQQIFPEIKIAVAHGQMRERELEKVMFEFQQNRYQILVCTTIIETGIDIANVNTIVIERADNFGLAQLHQLRGRVGRSHHQAYAYLLTPPDVSLTKDAKKRLEAIAETQSLGGGYMLANHDLEIRGAGEMLGKEQSGNIQSIGFNLYMDLLQKTINALQKGETFDATKINQSFQSDASIELRIPTLFPEEYIFDVHTRLGLYKRISSAMTSDELNQIKVEIIDRFGLLPEYGQYLFDITYLKLNATAIGIQKIEMHSSGGKISFITPLKFDPIHLIKIVQMQAQDFQLSQAQNLLIKKALPHAKERIAFINHFITKLEKSIVPSAT
ncbi:transcription-repair coupling factor [Fastidiosibacter lacustris]|uniref:transcription-repair coupling factor n=1 Tax=Fastidiosibacter lacustris TaxID=2056695 RepID=UPI0018646D09|nr:transcription-repair coupling factor [Fastidiosibacter lacustris]